MRNWRRKKMKERKNEGKKEGRKKEREKEGRREREKDGRTDARTKKQMNEQFNIRQKDRQRKGMLNFSVFPESETIFLGTNVSSQNSERKDLTSRARSQKRERENYGA